MRAAGRWSIGWLLAELPQSEFHLVHSRLVLERLADRREILDRLVATLKPGGWMVMEGRARLIAPTSPGFDFFRLTFESLRGSIVEAGLLTAEEADAGSAGCNESVRLLTPLMTAGIGRRG